MSLDYRVSSVIERIRSSILQSAEYAEHYLVAIGAVGFIGFPLFYIIWFYIYPQPYENLILRLVGSFLCMNLMLKDYWPSVLKRFLPFYWYITALYSLPFFFFFLVLKSNWAVIPVMEMLCGLFLLVLLVDWLSLILLCCIGSVSALVIYIMTTPSIIFPQIYYQYLLVYVFAIVAGTIFNYKTGILKREKLAAMSIISSSIAHELRTPLLGIKSGSVGIKRYLPILFDAYHLAKEHGLPITKIRAAHYNTLLPALERIESETNNANTIIDMLLMNVGKQAIDSGMFEICSMNDCVNEALKRYPFSSAEEYRLIHWQPSDDDFYFQGAKLLMVHVLFNLIKNALHFIAKARKGDVRIWVAGDDKHGYLFFKDSGVGIAAEAIPRIFERFYSTTISGTGIGLSFCRLVLESCSGSISCRSEEGEYTQFKLTLPICTKAVIKSS